MNEIILKIWRTTGLLLFCFYSAFMCYQSLVISLVNCVVVGQCWDPVQSFVYWRIIHGNNALLRKQKKSKNWSVNPQVRSTTMSIIKQTLKSSWICIQEQDNKLSVIQWGTAFIEAGVCPQNTTAVFLPVNYNQFT